MVFLRFLRVFILGLTIQSSNAWDSGLRQKYDGYGEDWIFMPDGKDQPQVAVLKGLESRNRYILENDTHISYILFTRINSEGTKLFTNKTAILASSNFDSSRSTKFIAHGWKSSAFSASMINMKNEYLKRGEYNIFLIDWEPLAASTFYLGPMRNTALVGAQTAEFIDFLIKETGLNSKDVHFIGHSLGAHVAGNTGEVMKSGKLGRITGLDPALPGFHLFSSEKGRLDPSDAEFVDIIHTCGGVLGYLQPLGHVDFYPNAGTAVQPGCCCAPEIMEGCSHGRSYQYFIESINSDSGLVAKPCESWDKYLNGDCDKSEGVLMGEHVNQLSNGSYFLRTRSEPPFAYVSEMTNEV